MFLALLCFCCSLYSAPSKGPDFIVIGVAKGGTTSLYEYLNDHPLIEMPETKEIHYFDDNYDIGVKKYLKNFPAKNRDGFPLSGDATPRYMARSYVPKRVFSTFPNTKLIVLLRNPVDRAFSHFKEHVYPYEFNTFEEALSKEFVYLRQGREDVDLVLLQRGFYAKFLKRWLHVFPKEQLLILLSEDFFKNPQATMDKIYDFLELPPYRHEEFPVSNKGRHDDIVIKEKTKLMLKEFYRPYNQDLQRLFDELELGITLKWD